jgi:hypothetical protein
MEAAMKRLVLAIAMLPSVAVIDISFTPPASAQNFNLICVEAAGFPTTARRRATRTDCSFRSAQSEAIRAARANASAALSATCIHDIHFPEQRASICRAQGLGWYNGPFQTMGSEVRASDGGAPIDGAIQLNATLCTVLRDLPNEASSTTVPDNFCFPFIDGQRTTFTARSRAHCGVICGQQF